MNEKTNISINNQSWTETINIYKHFIHSLKYMHNRKFLEASRWNL